MVSPLLANVLAARRPLFNRRVADARHRMPSLDLTAFSGFVNDTLDPMCMALGKVDEQATVAVIEAAFAIGLDLVGQGLAGPSARDPWIDRAWRQLAAPMAHLLAASPEDTLGTVTNAVVRLCSVPGVDVQAWITNLSVLAPRCADLGALRSVGALCAWRAGMAHLRMAALVQGTTIDPSLAAAAVGAPDQAWAELEPRLRNDRWWHPERGAKERGRAIGGFTGFGGPFGVPPMARATADGFVVQSGDRYFLVLCDAFGAVVLPATAAEFTQAEAASVTTLPVTPRGINLAGREVAVNFPGDTASVARGTDSAALFSALTHYLHVLPVPA